MNAVVEMKPAGGALAQTQNSGRMAVAEIISHVAMVQEVMRAVMKQDVHFGVIPGTDKPTLYKAGAEVLCMAFRVADSYVVEDLSADGMVRYRVTCIGTHQVTGAVLGSGMGEASSGEEKYKWRKAYDDEFDATPEHLRRIKLGKYKTKQIRTEPADLANTVLKMANKRAKMAMVLNVTAASDCFAQDLEDMDDALRDHLTRHEGEDAQPQARAAAPTGPLPWPDDALDARRANAEKWAAAGKTADDVIAFLATKGTLSEAQQARVRSWFAPPAASTDAPAVTFAQVADAIQKATNAEQLATAGDLISAVVNPVQRAELQASYERRESELKE